MADREVKTKMVLEGESGGMVSAMSRANAAIFGTKQQTSLLSEAGRELSGVVAGIGIVALAKQAIDAGLQMEKLTKLFIAATGSADLGAREMEYARQVADRMGLSFLDTAESYGKFLAASRNTTLEGEKGRKVFESVSGASVALGLSVDETKGIFNALQQMMSKGKVQAEELRGQLGDRLPGALTLSADAMGVTTAELDKMMVDGKLLASDLLPKLAEQLDKTYGKAAQEGAKGAQAEINRLNTAIFETKGVAGAALIPVFTDIVKAMKPALGMLQEFIGGIQILAAKAASITDRIKIHHEVYGFTGGVFKNEAKDAEYARRLATVNSAQDEVIADIMAKFSHTGSDYNAAEIARSAAIKPVKPLDTKKTKDDTAQWDSAHDKYLSYLEAYNASQVAITKAGMVAMMYENEQGYANGLVSLQQFLDKKREALKDELDEEYISALKNLDNRQIDLVDKSKTSAAKPNDAKAAAEYHEALKEVEKATISLTNVESKRTIALLKNSDESKKVLQDEALTQNAMAAKWAAVYVQNHSEALSAEREFYAMRDEMGGNSLQSELMRIDQERQALEWSWAMNSINYETYQQRMLEIEIVYGQKRANAGILNEQRLAQIKLQVNQNYLNGFTALANAVNTIAGGKNKVLYALTQTAAIATTFLSTEAAAAAALAPPPLGLGPIAGAPLAASIHLSGYASMAAMAATSIASIAGVGQSSTSSSSVGSSGTSVVTQPVSSTTSTQPFTVTFAPVFHGPVDEQALTRWTEDYMIPTLRDLGTRGVTI